MLIHRMHLDDNYVVLDINSGAVHLVDKEIYDLLGFYDGTNKEETIEKFSSTYPHKAIMEDLAALEDLQKQGLLFSPEFPVPDTFKFEPILKSLCLHIAHAPYVLGYTRTTMVGNKGQRSREAEQIP